MNRWRLLALLTLGALAPAGAARAQDVLPILTDDVGFGEPSLTSTVARLRTASRISIPSQRRVTDARRFDTEHA